MRAVGDAYAAFNAGDLARALHLLDPEVSWPDVMNERTVSGASAVRRYWEEQRFGLESSVEPLEFAEAGPDRIAVRVRQCVRELPDGDEQELEVVHLHAFRGERVTRMDVYYSLDEALAATGGPAASDQL